MLVAAAAAAAGGAAGGHHPSMSVYGLIVWQLQNY